MRHAPARPAIDAAEMENVLNDLAKLQLNPARPILWDQTNVADLARTDKVDAKKPFIISSDSEDSGRKPSALPLPPRTPVRTKKASQLQRLRFSVIGATDNAALAVAVQEFAQFLQLGSKTLTKEGFAFLDALYKQLADPSIFVQPLRTSRASGNQEDDRAHQPVHVKLGVVARLRREVGTASSNQLLASLVADFGAVTNRSSGRTITKDGFAFLEGLAARLRALN